MEGGDGTEFDDAVENFEDGWGVDWVFVLSGVHLDDEEAELGDALLSDAAGVGDAAGFGIGPAGGDEASGVSEGGLVDVAVGFEQVRVVFFGVYGVESGGGVLPDVGHRDLSLIHFFDQFFR